MQQPSIEALVSALDQELESDPRGARVAALLERFSVGGTGWQAFARFQPDCYGRNLVRASKAYELIVICWRGGQQSAIHDHDGQRCWMTVLEGQIRETLFDHHPGLPPALRSARVVGPGEVAFITDSIALHEIRPEGGDAISLHLYARPIRSCHTFCPETGRADTKRLSYHTVEGEPILGSA